MLGHRPTTRLESRGSVGAGARAPDKASSVELGVDVLLRATARGDVGAFKRLYNATSARLYAVVLRITKRPDVAEDVLQEVYLRIWQHAASQRGSDGSAFGWMLSIARNRALDWLRGQRDEQPYDAAMAVETASGDGNDIEALAQASADAKALHHCLSKLEPEQRRCIVLAYLDGYTHQELAEKLMAPLGSVKSWIRRGRIRLKECLGT